MHTHRARPALQEPNMYAREGKPIECCSARAVRRCSHVSLGAPLADVCRMHTWVGGTSSTHGTTGSFRLVANTLVCLSGDARRLRHG